MNISRVSSNVLGLDASGRERAGLRQCLNEICNALKIDEFERRIGTSRDAVSVLFSLMPKRDAMGSNHGKADDGFSEKLESDGRYRIDLSEGNLRVFRNCLYEVCNRIRLFEFQTRMGIELEQALAMLRVMSDSLAS